MSSFSNDQIDDIQSRLLVNGSHSSVVFKEVIGQKPARGQKETVGTCPFCGKEEKFSFNNTKPVWQCWAGNCQRKGNWFTYLKEQRGLEFREALQELARAAGVDIPGFDEEGYKQQLRQRSLMEAAQEYFSASLWKREGEPVLAYLKNRGLSEDDIRAMSEDIGAYHSQVGLLAALKDAGYEKQEVGSSGLLLEIKGKGEALGQSHQLTIAWRDATGRITGYQVRVLIPEAEQKERGWSKYLNTLNLSKTRALAGFQKARGAKKLVVVESPIDSALLQARGYKSVIATGGAGISPTQLSFLQSTGTEELFLALDKDEAGKNGIEIILTKSLPAGMIGAAWIPNWSEQYKDPGELVTDLGLQAFETAISKSLPASRWLAQRIYEKYYDFTDLAESRTIRESLRIRPLFEQPDLRLEAKKFEEELCIWLHIERDELAGKFAQVAQQAKEEQAKEQAREIQAKAERFIKEGDLAGLETLWETGLQDIRAARGSVPPEPYLLSSLLDDIVKTEQGLKTGFENLDKFLRIPTGALSYVAAYPGYGKTTLMLNILAKQLNLYPEKIFYFFSYEEAQKYLALKLIMLLSGQVIDKEFNQNAFINYLKEKRGSNSAIEKAIQQYEEWASSGRLIISDKSLAGEDLAATIAGLPGKQIGAIFVDYIQKVRLRKPSQVRYLEVKEVSNLLLEQAKLQDIPIISGSQMNKEGSLREAEDIFQDASLVLLLQNDWAMEAKAIREAGNIPKQNIEVVLKLQTMKQRGGVVGQRAEVYFHQPSLQINDKHKTPAFTNF